MSATIEPFGQLVSRLRPDEVAGSDGSAQCGKCFGRGYTAHVRKNARVGYTRRPGFTARNCQRCGGCGHVRIEREAARAAGEAK